MSCHSRNYWTSMVTKLLTHFLIQMVKIIALTQSSVLAANNRKNQSICPLNWKRSPLHCYLANHPISFLFSWQ
ncbi:hypothetical protein GDO86_001067 [Hymenochirus boettgeri]|uniref:Uncharacterized protein n=1 Tax=Hymenochirus boettgeri TaxID=247094 RepID=A0A8T2KK04_9PIPI|nr:hypothetical protein GDO86_001067 [Hymenochirus boettgeri]